MKMTREYIVKEGLLEGYYLGELSAAQEQEVFEILQSDAELKKQYEELEQSMEKLAFENAVTAPSNVKENLLYQISDNKSESSSEPKVIKMLFYKRYFGVAASIAVIFMTVSLVFWSQLNDVQKELERTTAQQKSLLDSLITIAKSSLEKENWIAYVNDPETERYLLQGNKLAPEAAVLSYVNHEQQSVLINIHNLPELKDKDYQMWADVDGEMIDMGVIDTSKPTLAMNYIENAESINITIEEKGGSDHPDVSNLIGSVAL
jgi:anti-sigma-K factor RskA